MAVVVEVADDRNMHAAFIELLNNVGNGGGSVLVVHRDSD